jgi:hypothetical protein
VVYRLVARSRAAAGLTSLREAYRAGRTADYRNRRVIAGDSLKGEEAAAAVRAVMLEYLDLRELPPGSPA